jgi:hypothetical protein
MASSHRLHVGLGQATHSYRVMFARSMQPLAKNSGQRHFSPASHPEQTSLMTE